jgi:hypothetical protein
MPVIGLGVVTISDTLQVEWPSGRVQEFQNVPMKQTLNIVERTELAIAAGSAGDAQRSAPAALSRGHLARPDNLVEDDLSHHHERGRHSHLQAHADGQRVLNVFPRRAGVASLGDRTGVRTTSVT